MLFLVTSLIAGTVSAFLRLQKRKVFGMEALWRSRSTRSPRGQDPLANCSVSPLQSFCLLTCSNSRRVRITNQAASLGHKEFLKADFYMMWPHK